MTNNPEPFAEFFDIIVIGDGENTYNNIIDVYKKYKGIKTRQEILVEIAKIPGLYVPALYEIEYDSEGKYKSFSSKFIDIPDFVEKSYVDITNNCLSSPVLSNKAFYANAFFIETSRGCPHKCKFCTASYFNHPVRYPSLKSIKEAIDVGVENTSKIVLIGALISEHPQFEDICNYIIEKRKSVKFELEYSSLSADKYNNIAVKALLACNKKEVSIAIEAGSQKMRDSVGKNLDSSQIYNIVKEFALNGIERLTLYMLIGLPDESTKDINETVELISALKKENHSLELNVIVSTLIPKPNTPFQWAQKESTESLKRKIDFLRKEFEKIQVKSSFSSPERDYISAIISRGDRKIAKLIEQVYRKNGKIETWQSSHKNLLKTGFDIKPLDWYALAKRNLDEPLPWDFIKINISKKS